MDIIDRRFDIDLNIAICIYPSPTLRHEKLKEKMMSFTEFYVKRIQEILPSLKYYKVESIDEGMDTLASKHDHILFLACGVRIYDESVIYDVVDMIYDTLKEGKQAYLAGAHILHWKEDWYELHNQFILVNSKSWLNCNKPFFGDFVPGEAELPVIERSEENFHDDYTPLWIEYTGETETGLHAKQGWNYINVGLKKGYKILNWPKEIRDKRTYYYPESDSELFYSCLVNRTYDTTLNTNQKKLLKVDKDVDKHIWVLNSERVDLRNPGDSSKCNNIKKVIVPAAGLKFLSAFKQNIIAEDGEIIFYDFSQNSLDWVKFLHSSSPTYDIPSLIMQFPNNKYLRVLGENSIISHTGEFIQKFWESYERSVNALGGIEKLNEYLKKFRKTKVKFIKCDLLNESSKLLEHFNESKNFFSISNIFCTDYSNIFVDRGFLEETYNNLVDSIPKDTYLAGFNPDGKFYSNVISRQSPKTHIYNENLL